MQISKKRTTSRKRKRSSGISPNDVKNIIIHVTGLKCEVDANPEVYGRSELKKLRTIVGQLSKSIWIDRTYVRFRGNRFKDAFIVEKGWKDLIETVKDSFANGGDKDEITSAIIAISYTYLYDMIMKYGYDPEEVSIEFGKKAYNFDVEYFVDDRTSWNF